jgi:hemoglobin/transferrin/lactoferrin receptor protein
MTHIGFAALAVAPVLSNAQDSSPSAPAGEAPAITVTVVATRSPEPTLETPAATSAVTVDQMRAQGAVSLGDALKYEPGVSVPFDFSAGDGLVPYLSGGDQGVNVRGIEGNRIAIQLDGIRQPEDFDRAVVPGAGGPGRIYFDPATLAQVEIFKSAASNLYGSDAMGGAVAGRTVSRHRSSGAGCRVRSSRTR